MNGVLERLVKYKIFVVEGPGNGAAVAGAGAENASNLLAITILLVRVVTVVEFHSVASKIQYIFTFK